MSENLELKKTVGNTEDKCVLCMHERNYPQAFHERKVQEMKQFRNIRPLFHAPQKSVKKDERALLIVP